MSLLNIDTLSKQVWSMLDKLAPPQGLEILSYKRNRSIALLKLGPDRFQVRERGYEEQDFETSRDQLPRKLKVLLKREFPRSRKLRVYQVAGPEELDRPRKQL